MRITRRGVSMHSQKQWLSRGLKLAFLRVGAAALVIALVALTGHAQTFRGSINGSVTDPSGAAVPNAKVKATETATGIEHNAVSTSDGQFSFQDIALDSSCSLCGLHLSVW